jgi:mechanosensitive ion channel-like protein
MTPITDWGTALVTSAAAALMLFLEAIPKIIGFLVILLIGWLIASALAGVVAALLRAVRFNDLARRSGLADLLDQMGIRTDASGAIATVAKWFVRLIVLVVAFDALGLPAVSQVLQSLLLWLPNVVVAIVALVIGGLAANALASLVRGAAAEAGFTNANLLATIARVAVWAFAIVVAVNQLGIATELVNTLFMATVGAVALAAGLAFGLGGRDTAGQIVASWYASGRRAAPKLERAADAAGRRARVETESEGMDDRTSSTAVASSRRTTGPNGVEPR